MRSRVEKMRVRENKGCEDNVIIRSLFNECLNSGALGLGRSGDRVERSVWFVRPHPFSRGKKKTGQLITYYMFFFSPLLFFRNFCA